MKPLAANTLLQNRYLIVHLIGKGGMGDVYLAIDQRLGSAVALKRTFFSGDEIFASAFEREARTLARLRHSVLPKVSDHFTEDDTRYLIMEHIAGDDLAKRLEISEKSFPVGWVLYWADQLLDALIYLHSQEPPVIHRDIKPQNLKLTDENSVVLLDFGLSKNTIVESSPSATTTASVVGYTPHFAPMEQIRGMGTNPRSDIYSLSATLYQLLTNLVPPETLIRAEDLLSGKPDPLIPANEVNPEVSQAVSNVILKGMAVSQEHRFSGAREMQKALREADAQSSNPNQVIKPADAKFLSAASSSQSQLKTKVSRSSSVAGNSKASFAGENLSQKTAEAFSHSNAQTPESNSNSRFFRFIGLGIPFALAIIAGIAWFVLYNSKPTPTPETPTIVSPTPTSASETNTNFDENISNENNENNLNLDSNIQSGDSKNQNSIDKNLKAAPSSPTITKNSSRPQPRQTIRSTPKPTPPSKVPKATPLPRLAT